MAATLEWCYLTPTASVLPHLNANKSPQVLPTFSKIGNYEQAEVNLVKVLEDFDCTDTEARRGLMALNPQRAQEIVTACDG